MKFVKSFWFNSICTWVLILVPSALQIVFVNPGYAKDDQLWVGIVIQVTYCMTMVSALVALVMTTCSDPGIVPRERKGNLPYINRSPTGGDLEIKEEEREDENFTTPGRVNQIEP